MVEPRVVWTDTALRSVTARRSEALPAATAVDRGELWARLRHGRRTFVEGDEHVTRVVALLEQPTSPPVDDHDLWAVMTRVVPRLFVQSANPLDFVLATSVRDAIAVYQRALHVNVVRDPGTRALAIHRVEPPTSLSTSRALRYALLRDPATTTWARTLLAPDFASGSLRVQSDLLYLLPNEVDWARSLANHYLDRDAEWYVVRALYESLTDLPLLARVVHKAGPEIWPYESLLDGVGIAALPMLLGLIPRLRPKNLTQLSTLAHGLAVVCDERVARFLAPHLAHNGIRDIVRDYFTRFPELGHVLRGYDPRTGVGARLVRELTPHLDTLEATKKSSTKPRPRPKNPATKATRRTRIPKTPISN